MVDCSWNQTVNDERIDKKKARAQAEGRLSQRCVTDPYAWFEGFDPLSQILGKG
jgi:hypothetical protein